MYIFLFSNIAESKPFHQTLMKEFDSEILLNKKCFFSRLYIYFDIMVF